MRGASPGGLSWRGSYGTSSTAGAGVYPAALNDTRLKASAIAGSMRARIASIASINEVSGGNVPASPFAGGEHGMQSVATRNVRINARGPVNLAVTFTLSNGRNVAVFGLARLESYVRASAHRFDLPADAILVTSVNVSS